MRYSQIRAGDKFGKLTVERFAFMYNHKSHFKCICECGKISFPCGTNLTNGQSKSCGCRMGRNIIHGKRYTLEYKSWQAMKDRCYNSNSPNYPLYGGIGRTVCERWRKSFPAFRKDMGERPPGTTLERINNDGDYGPDNCKWATMKEQRRNSKQNHVLEYNNKRMCITDWAKEIGISRYTLANRLRNGWSTERALTEKVHRRRTSL